MGEFYTKKSVNMGPILTPCIKKKKKKKNPKHSGQIGKKSVKKIMANIWKMGTYSLSKSYQNRSENMGPPFFLKMG